MSQRDVYEHGFDEANGKTPATDTCPECRGDLVTEGGETSCTACGLIVEEYRLDHGPEWINSGDDESNPDRTGAPLTPTRHDRGLSTEIGRKRDANGNTLSGRKRRQMNRLRREHKRGRWQSKQERNLGHGLAEVRRITSDLGVGESLRDQACSLFRTAQNADLLRGRSIESMAAASVYAAIRCNGLSWTLDEIGARARCDVSRVQNAYAVLNTDLDLPTRPRRPSEFLPRFASELEIPDYVRRRAEVLARRGEQIGAANGVRPTGFAGACLYRAAQEKTHPLTQADVTDVAGVSPVTIRNNCERLTEQVIDP